MIEIIFLNLHYVMDKIKIIQDCLREEIERTQKNLEEKVKCKFYKDAAFLEERKETLDWVWNLVAGFVNKDIKNQCSILNIPLIELDLTVRTMNVLKLRGFENLGQVVNFDRTQLLNKKCGKKVVDEIEGLLEQHGLKLGVDNTGFYV